MPFGMNYRPKAALEGGIRMSKPVTPENLAGKSEDSQQMALFCWAALPETRENYPQLKYLFAIPNGGSRHIAEAAKFVATGLRKGVPDIMLPWPCKLYFGAFIEMKVGKGKPTVEQIEWIQYLESAGYYCRICWSWEEARDCLINYIEGKL
jgi:hypothetical protein